MQRRTSKATTNYQFQRFSSDHLFKKQSCNEQTWKMLASASNSPLEPHSRTLSLFFDNPPLLLGCRRAEHFSQAQRLREGVYILLKGRIRVLLCKQAKNAGKMQIEHAIYKMENRPRSKCCAASNKLNIIEVNEPYQVVLSTNNCIAMPDTSFCFISPQELLELQFHDRLKAIRDLLFESEPVFTVDLSLPFIYRHLVFSFRNRITLPTDLELAVVRKGDVVVQWTRNPMQRLIIGEGSVLIRSEEYCYFCHSSQVDLVGVRANSTYRYIGDPLWTKRPETGTPTLPKEQSKDKILLFRSRSKNLQRLTSGNTRKFFKKSMSPSLSRSQDIQNKPFSSKSSITFSTLQSSKERWLFMRKIEGYQVASNTRSEVEYQRIDAIRQRFKRENLRSPHAKQQAILAKKMVKNKLNFSQLPSKKDACDRSHLFDSVSNFFKRQLTQHHR